MGYLVTRGSGGNVSYSGTNFVNPSHGTHRICIRTGTGANDIVKYGLTTNSTASQYCGMRFYIDGKKAMIGRYQAGNNTYATNVTTNKYTSRSYASSSIYTASRSSGYTANTASRSSGYNTTRSSQYNITSSRSSGYTANTSSSSVGYNTSRTSSYTYTYLGGVSSVSTFSRALVGTSSNRTVSSTTTNQYNMSVKTGTFSTFGFVSSTSASHTRSGTKMLTTINGSSYSVPVYLYKRAYGQEIHVSYTTVTTANSRWYTQLNSTINVYYHYSTYHGSPIQSSITTRTSGYSTTRSSQYNITSSRSSQYVANTASRASDYSTTRSSAYDVTATRSSQYNLTSNYTVNETASTTRVTRTSYWTSNNFNM